MIVTGHFWVYVDLGLQLFSRQSWASFPPTPLFTFWFLILLISLSRTPPFGFLFATKCADTTAVEEVRVLHVCVLSLVHKLLIHHCGPYFWYRSPVNVTERLMDHADTQVWGVNGIPSRTPKSVILTHLLKVRICFIKAIGEVIRERTYLTKPYHNHLWHFKQRNSYLIGFIFY